MNQPSNSSAASQIALAPQPTDGQPGDSGTDRILGQVLALYDQGRYLDALEVSRPLGDLRTWSTPEGRVLAGRLAGNLGAPRLGRCLHWLAGREYADHPQAQYYAAMAYWKRYGTVHAWRRYRQFDLDARGEVHLQADWLAMKAVMLGAMRDFSRAEPLMIEALELDPTSPWLHVELSELLDRQDLHQESLRAAQESLKYRPNFRPGVQATAYRLVQLRRDDEALQVLHAATQQLQSGEVWCQLAALQRELQDYAGAWESLARAETLWPLAQADSEYSKWLIGQRCDVAYFLGRYDEAIELAEKTERPYFQRMAERLRAALAKRAALPAGSEPTPRVQLPVPFVRQFHDTCVPATLSSLAQYWNKPVKHEEIAERICYEGTKAYDERAWAEENGFAPREFRITEQTVEQLIRQGIPMTLTTVDPGSAHSQGIVGIDVYRGTLLIQDPNERHIGEAASDKFLEQYASTGPRGMLMVPQEEVGRLAGIQLQDAELYDDHYLADSALAKHDRQAAVLAIQRMLQRDPEHRLTLQCQLSLARYDANPADQTRLVDQLLAQFPTDANLQLMKVGLLSEFGQRNQRIDRLRSVCTGDHTHPIFWSRLAAELLDDARDHDEAYYQLRRACRYNPSDGRALSLLADYYWNRQQREEALEYYRLAASLNEKDETQARRYFMAARYLNQTQEALLWLRDRYQRFGQRNSSPGRTLASSLETIDLTAESLQVVNQTADSHPEDGEMLCWAAMCFARYNQLSRAAQLLESAQGKCSELTLLRSQASIALYQGQLPQARQLFLEVVRLAPLDIEARESLLQLDLDLDGQEVAERRLRDAVERFPHSYSLRVVLIQFLRSYKLAEVDEQLDQFLQFHPRDAWARREAAIVAISSHDLARATEQIQLAQELEPHNPIAYFLQGRVLEQQGDIPAARQAYRRALELNIDYDSAIASLIETCDRPAERTEQLDFILAQLRHQTTYGDAIISYRDAANGRLEPAKLLEHLEEALAQRPDLWQVWSVVSQQHSAMNERHKAIQVAEQATERFPLVPRSWLDLALAHRRAGDHEAELAALERARAINPHWSEVARELAELYMSRDQFDQAEQVLRQILVSDPREASVLASLGDCLHRSGQQAAALEPLAAACISTPGYDWAWSRLCQWSSEVDQGQRAKEAAQKAIDARPHDARCYRRMAEALQELEDIPQGLEYLEKCLQLDNRSVDAHVLKAFYLGRLHLWDEALEACRPPVFADDIPVALRMRRAYILYRKGLGSEAIDEMREALKRDPDHYGAWNQLADWAEEQQRRDVYKQASENMVRLDPHQPAPRGYLADALLAEENGRPEAKKHLRAALEFSPNYAYGTMRLFDLHIQDGELDEAEKVLQLGGPHLPAGYDRCLQVQLLSARDVLVEPLGEQSLDLMLTWCREKVQERGPFLRALDQMDTRLGKRLIDKLAPILNAPSTPADNLALATAYGRLLARLGNKKACKRALRDLPDGDLWHESARTLIGALNHFKKEFTRLEFILQKYDQRLKSRTETWAAVSDGLLDYGRNSSVVYWTQDWTKRTDLTATQMLPVIASRWELFQLSAARKAVVHALSLAADDNTPFLRVWAGLDAVLQGQFAVGLEHARAISTHQLSGWYTLGYRMLVAALESLPGVIADAPPVSQAQAKELVAYLLPGRFPVEPQFANDKTTQWILRQLAAQVAKAHSLTMESWKQRLLAWLYRK